MDHQRWSLRVGATVIACALVLRLGEQGCFAPAAEILSKPNIASFLLYLETGRVVRFSHTSAEVFARESPAPVLETVPVQERPVFQASDAEGIQVKNSSGLTPDLGALVAQPLDWDLTGEEPTVLILSTHATESYTKAAGEDYRESASFRTLDEGYNMISLGDQVAALLEAGGITVIQDRSLHDYPSYSGSYSHARKSVQEYLEEYPSIRLVLDLHRDASGDLDNQMKTAATVNGQESAQIMLVVGTNGSGLDHPKWQENLALALKLHVQLERLAPGITRYVNLRRQRFNQDLSQGALLVELGAAGNSHREALVCAQVLAQGILALAKGTGG